MKLFFMLGLIVVLGITVCGCSQPVSVPSTDTIPSSIAVTDKPVTATGLPLATLSNNNPSTSLTLDPGIIIVTFQAYDPQTMVINQDCKQSWAESSEVRTTSPYNGSLAFGIPEKDECTINISSTGSWTAQLSQYDLNNSLKAPVNLSGFGTTVSQPFTLEKGEYIFERKETGLESPLYYLTFSNGNYLMDANNTFVQPGFDKISPDTFRIINIPENGTYFLSILADQNPMPWNVSITSLPAAPQMGPGPAIRE